MFNFILPQFFIKVERWKWNSEYRVYVSNLGNFKNEHKQRLPIKIDSSGYCLIKTEYCGYKRAHRVVMLTWKPIPNAEELTVDHLDHNKRNNSLENLEWVTKEENELRAKKDFILDKKDNIVNKENIILKAGKRNFHSYEEAAEWLIVSQGMKNTSEEIIIRRIKNAIKNNKMYCGRKWKEV